MFIRQLHDWHLSAREAIQVQRELAEKVETSQPLGKISVLAAVDVSYQKSSNMQYAAIVLVDLNTQTIIKHISAQAEAAFPYVPGLLSFREIPVLIEAFRSLDQIPDVVLCDGQGIAHPRRIGIASHLGIWLGIPTVGCAKSRLCGKYSEPDTARGSTSPLVYYTKQIGTVVRTRKNVKPVFVSPGHMCDMESAVRLVLATSTRYRLPDPIREAHNFSNEIRRSHLEAMTG